MPDAAFQTMFLRDDMLAMPKIKLTNWEFTEAKPVAQMGMLRASGFSVVASKGEERLHGFGFTPESALEDARRLTCQSDGYLSSEAYISPCGVYRYGLQRVWNLDYPECTFIMLNPSTADGQQDDPTIRRCVGFAKSFGCGRLTVVNLFAFRATDPSGLRHAADPIGPENDAEIVKAIRRTNGPLVAAWGVHGRHRFRDGSVRMLIASLGAKLQCLGKTKDGHPKHPLYVKSDTMLETL